MSAAFHPPWWLQGSHSQSLWGPFVRQRSLVDFDREVIATPDGDELLVDHLAGATGPVRLLVLHGLEGSSYSPYVQGLLLLAREQGWRGTAFNCRSCARDPQDTVTWIPNRRPRLYHSGDTGDFDLVVRHLKEREPDVPLVAAGASMGGNVLLKWLGENPGQRWITAAATLSAAYDLGAGARHLESRVGRLYVRHFLQSLRAKLEHLVTAFPELRRKLDVERAMKAEDFRPFDNAATAPLYGFADADDFYAKGSAISYIDRITTPTLCLSAEDDPLMPRSLLPLVRERASAALEPLFVPYGGHVGFIDGPHPMRPRYWGEAHLIQWLARQAAAVPAPATTVDPAPK